MKEDVYFAVDCLCPCFFCVCDQLVLMISADLNFEAVPALSLSMFFYEAIKGLSSLWIPWSALYFVSLDAV